MREKLANTRNRLKIAYVTSTDARDRRSWSGTHYFIAQALQKHCGDVYYIGPLKSYAGVFLKLFSKLLEISSIGRRRYNYVHSALVSREFADIISARTPEKQFDMIFAPAASTEVAYLATSIPIVYLSDATFSLMVDYNNRFSNLIKLSIREGNLIEASAIKRASLILYSSEWAAASAIKDYGADKGKVRVVPFGANIEDAPSSESIIKKRLGEKNSAGTCKLLFLGVSWEGKGGRIAFETLVELEKMGIDVELIICGCVPPAEFEHARLRVVPFLDKNNPNEREKLNQLLMDADFLLLPTRYDCSPIVFCEANAFGLPVITTNTGGISFMVRDGINGFMLPMGARGHDYAGLIRNICLNQSLYENLVRNSRREFEDRLNWDVWGMAVREAIEETLIRKVV